MQRRADCSARPARLGGGRPRLGPQRDRRAGLEHRQPRRRGDLRDPILVGDRVRQPIRLGDLRCGRLRDPILDDINARLHVLRPSLRRTEGQLRAGHRVLRQGTGGRLLHRHREDPALGRLDQPKHPHPQPLIEGPARRTMHPDVPRPRCEWRRRPGGRWHGGNDVQAEGPSPRPHLQRPHLRLF